MNKLARLGASLRRVRPKLQRVPLSDEELAYMILNEDPENYKLLSPTAARIKDISERPIQPEGWTRKGREESAMHQIDRNLKEASALHHMDQLIFASTAGIPVEALAPMAIKTHETNEQMRLKTHEVDEEIRLDNHNLENVLRYNFHSHNFIDYLNNRLDVLIDRHRDETNELKKKVLWDRIYILIREINARQRQEAVQAGDESGLGSSDEDSHDEGTDGEGSQADVEPIPAEDSGIGFGRSPALGRRRP